ncbi:MAG: glycosyltransferase family 2 protein [Solirubrobacterales bacterium]
MPTVSVIVPLFNGMPHLDAFFESLVAALPERAQVIIVDDGSTEPVLDVVPEIPRADEVVCLRNETNLGNAGAVNRAFEVASGEILVQLNSDLVLDPNCIGGMVKAIEQGGSDLGIVGSKLVYPTTGRTQSVGLAFGLSSKPHIFRHMPENHPLCSRSRDVQMVTGATVAMTRRVLEQLGPLDDRLYNHNLDLDHCLRAVSHGLRNYMCADSLAYHWRNRSGVIRYARVEAAEAAFWAKWGGKYRVDLGKYFDESIDHLLATNPQLQTAPFTVLDLSRSADQSIALESLEARWQGIRGTVRDYTQRSNGSEYLWLPLLVPNWTIHEPTPFIYLVDSHRELEENAMWLARRRAVVAEEVIVDLSASVFATSEFCEWQSAAASPLIENVVDVVDS